MLLWSLLVAVAFAGRFTRQWQKIETVCNGIEDADHSHCYGTHKTEDACDDDEKCMWDKDRVMKKYVDMKKCLVNQNVNAPIGCDKDSQCKCGQKCIHLDGMNKSLCQMCMDNGTKEDCENSPQNCFWVPEYGDADGQCMPKKDECNELEGKKPCKNAMTCDYDGKYKYCSINYKPSCYGVNEDTHAMCMDIVGKDECLEKCTTNVFNKKTCHCKWGKNDKDREEEKSKCIKMYNVNIAKNCDSQADCTCGTTCLEQDFGAFKSKGCKLCKDMGVEADCETAAKAGMGCKWVHNRHDDKGLCLKKDACKELSLDGEDECKKNKACKWDKWAGEHGACYTAKPSKKICKNIGKGKRYQDDDEKLELRNTCELNEACFWNTRMFQFGKCVMRKY